MKGRINMKKMLDKNELKMILEYAQIGANAKLSILARDITKDDFVKGLYQKTVDDAYKIDELLMKVDELWAKTDVVQ